MTSDVGNALEYPQDIAQKVLSIAKSMGFEAKLFSSFGKKDFSACGMLGGKEPDILIANSKYIELEKQAVSLVDKIAAQLRRNI